MASRENPGVVHPPHTHTPKGPGSFPTGLSATLDSRLRLRKGARRTEEVVWAGQPAGRRESGSYLDLQGSRWVLSECTLLAAVVSSALDFEQRLI